MADNVPEERKKSRWRTKFFDKVNNASDDSLSRSVEQKLNVDEDVMDFLKPSTQKSVAQPRAPRIDVAAAPRWPGASDLQAGSPGFPSSMRGGSFKSRRRPNVAVSFVSTAPEIIGEGGDESEEPVIQVSLRRKASPDGRAATVTQDDAALGLRTPASPGAPKWSVANVADAALKRSKTTQAQNNIYQVHRQGTGGLDERELEARAFAPPARQPTDDVEFSPARIKRTQTGFSNVPDPSEERKARIPELAYEDDSEGSPINPTQELDHHLETGPSNPRSFSSRVQHKMRAEEGRALRESLLIEDDSSRPSTAGSSSRPLNKSSELLPQPRRSGSINRPRQASITSTQSADPSMKPVPSPSYPPSIFETSPTHTHSSRLAPTSPNDIMTPPTHTAQNMPPLDVAGQYSRRPSAVKSEFDMAIQPSPVQPSPQPSPAIPSSANDSVLQDFANRVTHMQGIFRLTAELEGQLYDHRPMKWLRAAIWWFLRGRAGIETHIRSRPRGEPAQELLTQPHVDLAKTWWILYEVFPQHPALPKFGDGTFRSSAGMARDQGDLATAEVYNVAETIAGNLKALLASMSRNGAMPPRSSLVQGQDQSIWIKYPNFAQDVQAVLSGQTTRSLTVESTTGTTNPLKLMPLMDTPEEFSFGRMFVQASLSTDEAETDRVPIPCMLSIMRPTADFQVKLAICSLAELVNIVVQGDPKVGPTWEDVQWKTRSRGMYVRLPRGFTLSVELSEKDYRTLWGIDDYTRRIEASLQPAQNERMVFEVAVQEFQFSDSNERPAFPSDRVRRCRARVFERVLVVKEGYGQRRFHRGYRLLICTSPKNKTLSSVSQEFGTGLPMNFEYRTDAINGEAAPALVLRMREPGRKSSMNLVFKQENERNQLYCVLNGMVMSKEEAPVKHMPLKSFTVEQAAQAEGFIESGRSVMGRLQWNDVRVINYAPRGPNEQVRTIMSDSLRLLARHNAGSITDRLNLGPGELSIRLSVAGDSEISLLRGSQDDVAMSIDHKRIEPGVPDSLEELLAIMVNEATIRTLTFRSLSELHSFQAAITGFNVIYDGIASTFAIARRRMVVPIYKKWEATTVRVQIVQQDTVVQLLAFFEDYSHADAMSFALKTTDIFEQVEKAGKQAVKLVDAKFPLPPEADKSKPPEAARRFVCLDMPEYPGEHDDITVGFNSEAERDRFIEALPAPTNLGRTQSAFRRRI